MKMITLCDIICNMSMNNNICAKNQKSHDYNNLNKSPAFQIISPLPTAARDDVSNYTKSLLLNSIKNMFYSYKNTFENMDKQINQDIISLFCLHIFKSERCPPCKSLSIWIQNNQNYIDIYLQKSQFSVIWKSIFTKIAGLKTHLIKQYNDQDAQVSKSIKENISTINDYILNLINNVSYGDIKDNIHNIINNMTYYLPEIFNIQMDLLDLSCPIFNARIDTESLDVNIYKKILKYHIKTDIENDIIIKCLNDIVSNNDVYNDVVSKIIQGRSIDKILKDIVLKHINSNIDNISNLCYRILHFAIYTTCFAEIYNHVVLMCGVAIVNVDIMVPDNNEWAIHNKYNIETIPQMRCSLTCTGINPKLQDQFSNLAANYDGDILRYLSIRHRTDNKDLITEDAQKLCKLLMAGYIRSADNTVEVFFDTILPTLKANTSAAL